MPIPINPNHITLHDNDNFIDYDHLSSFLDLTKKKKQLHADSQLTSMLFDLWTKCKNSNGKINLNEHCAASDLDNLIKANLVKKSDNNQIELTTIGKEILKIKVLSESNKFLIKQKRKCHKEIMS